MARYTAQELLEAFGEMSVLELSEFTSAFEEQFGVSARFAAPGPAVPPDGGDAPEEDEQAEFDVILQEVGAQKIQVIKAARALTGLGLKEAKDLVESAPAAILKGADTDAAARAKAELESAGAVAVLR